MIVIGAGCSGTNFTPQLSPNWDDRARRFRRRPALNAKNQAWLGGQGSPT
jgi:hypothetical protein